LHQRPTPSPTLKPNPTPTPKPTAKPTPLPTHKPTPTPIQTLVPSPTIYIIDINQPRIPTGKWQKQRFNIGDTIVGYKIEFDNCKESFVGEYYIYNSPYAGIVTDGVIHAKWWDITHQTQITYDMVKKE
jgi:hypothetical protein